MAAVVRCGDEGPALYVGLRGEVGALYFTQANEGCYSQGNVSDKRTGNAPAPDHDPGESLIYDWQQNEFQFPPDADDDPAWG